MPFVALTRFDARPYTFFSWWAFCLYEGPVVSGPSSQYNEGRSRACRKNLGRGTIETRRATGKKIVEGRGTGAAQEAIPSGTNAGRGGAEKRTRICSNANTGK